MSWAKQNILKAIAAVAICVSVAAGTTDYFEITKNLDVFASLYKELNTYYVDPLEPEKLVHTALDAMLESLDPYTNFISEEDLEGYNFQTTGKYGGIGATVRKSGDYVMIAEPYEGFAAYDAGLRAGDVLLEINGVNMKGKNTEDASRLLKGDPGTKISLLIQSAGSTEPQKKELVRREITLHSMSYSGMITPTTGYIRLNQFTDKCGQEVADALTALKKNNPAMSSLIFDLRGNPGGLLNEAVNVANVFVARNEKIVFTKGKVKDWDKDYYTLNSATDAGMPLVVLANRNSASAAEIVSGAIQDLDRGVIVGQRTFGKGLVQTTRNTAYNSKLKVTTAKYYIPSGRCIQALDYAHRAEDGSVDHVPDSLKTAFKTKGGRTVYDGGGIEPDVKTTVPEFSRISSMLLNQPYVFDWVTEFTLKHPTISPAKDFNLSDADYNDFIKYLETKDYHYETATEKIIGQLKTTATQDNTLASIQPELTKIESQVLEAKKADIIKNKDEIKEILETEIVSRYYFQRGKMEATLSHDPEVKEALEVLNHPDRYRSLLTAKN